ncbi:MAG: 1-deoxy-D-xylulose-5-phosphate reductoisomerase [Treponema sp.]|jgi:1-deoxy-D-xylulose-5-phosphate reductoisomerase|nr:1-deoxy-D-xylulose-5-phosphate reductoisomerase [Treponema sp.]
MKKRVAVLGATGSIGKSALDVILAGREHFEVVLLCAHTDRAGLAQAGAQWPKAQTVLSSEPGGKEALLAAIANARADITINGISGASGLEPSIAAIESGSALALANKETLVMAGPLVLKLAAEKKAPVIPVDSEHSAIFQLINAHGTESLDEIILTASGGPFRNLSLDEMRQVSPESALAHPTWNMGPKITIDSASMANKGLEVIEAACLFNMPPEKIKVVIQPQSIIHSMIRMKDGALYAQLSRPDMRLPISSALYWPEITHSAGFGRLDFDSLTLEFSRPDMEKFPMLGLAYQALKNGGLYPCAYNAANEAAVAAFLRGQTGFLDIAAITEYVLSRDWSAALSDIASVLESDAQARALAETFIRQE